MTQPLKTAAASPIEQSVRRNPTLWAPLARQAIRRLQAELTDSWDLALEPEAMDLPNHLETAMAAPAPSALDLLNSSPAAQNISPEEYHAIIDAGGDPAATAGDGTARPRICLPGSRLLPLIRLAASIGPLKNRDAMLVPGAITVMRDVPDDLLDSLKKLLAYVLPPHWIIAPDISEGKASRYAQTSFDHDLASAIDRQAPLLILLPTAATIPDILHSPTIRQHRYAPVDTGILLTALRATHSATGRIDEAALRAILPGDDALAGLDALPLSVAMCAPPQKPSPRRSRP